MIYADIVVAQISTRRFSAPSPYDVLQKQVTGFMPFIDIFIAGGYYYKCRYLRKATFYANKYRASALPLSRLTRQIRLHHYAAFYAPFARHA